MIWRAILIIGITATVNYAALCWAYRQGWKYRARVMNGGRR